MSCITLTALEEMMTTTELTPTVSREIRTPWLPQNAEQTPVHMNWVVVNDKNGDCQLRMRWQANRAG